MGGAIAPPEEPPPESEESDDEDGPKTLAFERAAPAQPSQGVSAPSTGRRADAKRTMAFEAVPGNGEVQRTMAFQARPAADDPKRTVAFEARPATPEERRSARKKGLSATIAFGDEEVAATQREVVERMREEAQAQAAHPPAAASAHGAADDARGDRRTPPQFASAEALGTVPRERAVPLERTVAFEASKPIQPTATPKRKKSFGHTIAFGAASEPPPASGPKSGRSQTIAFGAVSADEARPSQPPGERTGAATLAFEVRPSEPPAERMGAATMAFEARPFEPPPFEPPRSASEPPRERRSNLDATLAFDPTAGRENHRKSHRPSDLGSTMAFEAPSTNDAVVVDESSHVSIPDAPRGSAQRTMIGGAGAFAAPQAPAAPPAAAATIESGSPGAFAAPSAEAGPLASQSPSPQTAQEHAPPQGLPIGAEGASAPGHRPAAEPGPPGAYAGPLAGGYMASPGAAPPVVGYQPLPAAMVPARAPGSSSTKALLIAAISLGLGVMAVIILWFAGVI